VQRTWTWCLLTAEGLLILNSDPGLGGCGFWWGPHVHVGLAVISPVTIGCVMPGVYFLAIFNNTGITNKITFIYPNETNRPVMYEGCDSSFISIPRIVTLPIVPQRWVFSVYFEKNMQGRFTWTWGCLLAVHGFNLIWYGASH
jgi:hypothetical protein